MHSKTIQALSLLFASTTLASPFKVSSPQNVARAANSLPFNKVIAFGDDFTDNGDGSFAHGITGKGGDKMWGNGTFTNGPIAVSYMAEQLGLPLVMDYAYGSSGGAGTVGSVCDNSLIPAAETNSHAKLLDGSIVPSALDQIANYTSHSPSDADSTLYFLWTGNNDVIGSLAWAGRFTICTDGLCDAGAQTFVKQVSGCMAQAINNLVASGAKHIIVPNVYPRHLSPWTSMWISSDPGHIANFGATIDKLNKALSTAIDGINSKNADKGVKVMYYDANAYMQAAMKNTQMTGLLGGSGYTDTCVDGCTKQIPGPISNWNLYWQETIVKKTADYFYWMTEVVPSTTVHKAIAGDMAKFLQGQDC